MTDLGDTIAPKSDQLNADDLITGPRTITITGVRIAKDEQPVAISYEGDGGKPYKPGLSMRRVLVMLWGKDQTLYVGRRLTLVRDPEVMFGKDKVGGIRISHMSHIDRDRALPLTTTRGQRKPYQVKRLVETDGAGDPPDQADLNAFGERALLAARQGTTTFLAFWNREDVKPIRARLAETVRNDLLAECKDLAKAADTKGAPTEEHPFDGGADDDPSPEELARAEEAALIHEEESRE